jgi:HlyD family secretion protein
MRGAWAIALVAVGLVAGCNEQPAGVVNGYVEGEYVYVAAPEGGWVTQVLVQRGMQVKAGDLLFTLDADAQSAAREMAAAQLAQAQSQLANTQKGLRPDEIAALQASLGQAKANLQLMEADLVRAKDLRAKGFLAQSALDAKQAQRDVAAEQVKQIQSQISLGRKGARPDEIAAADANVGAAKAALERADYALSQRRITTKVAGRVEDTLRRAGEFAAAGAAVVQLLPPQNVKVRFFVPEQARARLAVGTQVAMRCDGCPPNLRARVTFIASDAEFTPPVIYSVGSREKLVWMVEAVPEGAVLSPGQPVDVTLP